MPAFHHGTLGDYIYPCPLDQSLLDFAGLTSQVFLAGVKEKSSHEECKRWIRQIATPRTRRRWKTGINDFWRKDRKRKSHRSIFTLFVMGLTPPGPISRPGLICWIWKKGETCRNIQPNYHRAARQRNPCPPVPPPNPPKFPPNPPWPVPQYSLFFQRGNGCRRSGRVNLHKA